MCAVTDKDHEKICCCLEQEKTYCFHERRPSVLLSNRSAALSVSYTSCRQADESKEKEAKEAEAKRIAEFEVQLIHFQLRVREK